MAVVQTTGVLKARAHEAITPGSTATGFTSSKYDFAMPNSSNWKVLSAEEVLVTVEVSAIRWTVDGTTPTVDAGTALGHTAKADTSFVIVGYENIKNFKCIDVSTTTAKIRATFYFRQ